MQEVAEAREIGDSKRLTYAQTMVDYFTDQMNESNPILTQISEAMTEEGVCVEKLSELMASNNLEEIAIWEARLSTATERKNSGNIRLMDCSSRYNDMMKSLRESRQNDRSEVCPNQITPYRPHRRHPLLRHRHRLLPTN